MLVLGDKALKHGLATSLLERLYELYKGTERNDLYHGKLLIMNLYLLLSI